MRALVIYESMFGNTQRVAQAVADGIGHHIEVDLVEVSAAPCPPPPDVDLLVLGGPTHAFGLSRPNTRQDARQRATSLVSDGIGIREWISRLPETSGIAIAVFDTKMNRPTWLPGSAARSAAKLLRRQRLRVIANAESFYVTGMTGPLAEGELDRARAWGEQLAAQTTRLESRRS